ncbi:hypothetical protein CRUP_028471 [Coryphaenoides rupestris]|nr:hypothetical protein CRUP_028471 [Coryphaenoides rupestris]
MEANKKKSNHMPNAGKKATQGHPSLKSKGTDNKEWMDSAAPDTVLRVLVCLRLLIRDPHYQTLVKLLSSRDSSVLLGSLIALTSLAERSVVPAMKDVRAQRAGRGSGSSP